MTEPRPAARPPRPPAPGIRHPWAEPPPPGGACPVAEGILWLRLPLPARPDHVNIYALADPDGWTVVDTGLDDAAGRAAWAALRTGPLAGRPLARVLVTHHHPDHIGRAGALMAAEGAELWTARTAYLLARMLWLDVPDRPPPETLAFWRAAGMAPEILDRRAAERPYTFRDRVAALPLGFVRVQAGDVLELGGRAWEVTAGEGHAPEHLVLWSRDGEVVIGGDQLLPGISPHLGVYATEPAADPLGAWLESCRAMSPRARDRQLVLPGHGLPYRGLPARLAAMIAHHEAALDRLRAHLAAPRTAAECFAPLFGREVEPEVYGFALAEAVAHLNHLRRRGEVTRTAGPGGAWLWRRPA